MARGKTKQGHSFATQTNGVFALSGATVILMFVSLLLIFGITGSGTKETKRFMENELAHISQGVSEDFGKLSLQGVALSEDEIGRAHV